MPLRAATVVALTQKLWLEKLPGIPATAKICLIQLVRLARDKGLPSWNKNIAPPPPSYPSWPSTTSLPGGYKGVVNPTNVDEATFAERVSLGRFYPNT